MYYTENIKGDSLNIKMKSLSIIFLNAYIIVSVINIIGRIKNNRLNDITSKPLILPLLLGFYITTALFLDFKISALVISALILGNIGDILLMFTKSAKDKYFILGMLSFLAGHLMYFFFFLWHSIPLQHIGPVLVGCIAMTPILILFFIFVYHSHHPIWPAIWAYGLMTTLLIISGCTTFGIGPYYASIILIIGTIIFATSDFLILLQVLNKIKNGRAIVMITYTLAQLLINIGIILISK